MAILKVKQTHDNRRTTYKALPLIFIFKQTSEDICALTGYITHDMYKPPIPDDTTKFYSEELIQYATSHARMDSGKLTMV